MRFERSEAFWSLECQAYSVLSGRIGRLHMRGHADVELRKWYQRISEETSISGFFTGQRPQVMMFQTKFWKKARCLVGGRWTWLAP